MCEISRSAPHGSKESSGSDHFLVSIDVEGGAFGTLLILRAVPQAHDQTSRMHHELGLPLSQTGTIFTEGTIHLKCAGLTVEKQTFQVWLSLLGQKGFYSTVFSAL